MRLQRVAGRASAGTLDYMEGLWISLVFGAPWLVAIAWVWSRGPRMDGLPPSMADRMREHLSRT